jgi:hypothetical protein
VEGDSRHATLHCSVPGLPVLPIGLSHPLHLAHPLVLDLADPLHLNDPLHLVVDSNSAVPDESGDDAGSKSSKETDL